MYHKPRIYKRFRPLQGWVGTAHRQRAIVAVVGLLLIAGTIVAVRYFSRSKLSTQDSAPRTQAQPALPLPDKPSIVVLPFVNMSKDPNKNTSVTASPRC